MNSQTSVSSEAEVDRVIAKLVSDCDLSSASSIDEMLRTIEADDKLPYSTRERFIAGLSAACPYSKRLAFLLAICEAVELSFTQSLDKLAECFRAWSRSSFHLVSNSKKLVERLFECKSAELFEDQYSNIVSDIHWLSDFCGDKRFVLQLVLRKVAADEVELDGDEWLQLATTLCDVTSGQTGLDALELLLSGSVARVADEIGEGVFRPEQVIEGSEEEFISDVIWHLLGNSDAYVRWTVARGLNTLVELGLKDELGLLLDRFNVREVAVLASTEQKLSFQNSQQWLLMGLARAALRHGQTMGFLQPSLLVIAQRSDLHVINKVHIARCLRNIDDGSECDANLNALFSEINQPLCGVVICDVSPRAASSTTGFRFDYEFTKYEINNVASLFNVAQAIVEDAMATEITQRWPEATSMDYFTGSERYQWDRGDRYEYYREHIQRHALLSAASSLSKTLPVVVRSYEFDDSSPWQELLNRYDVTFDDGSWLSDRKNPVPQQARENLLGKRIGHQETLQDQQTMLQKLGFVDTAANALFPLYGRWTSPDGVSVSITSALTEGKGSIGRCTAFAKQPSHDLWLPEFWDAGYYDHRNRQKNTFDPLVWAPENHRLGIDMGDEIAAEGPGRKPRLGIDITKSLKLVNELNSGDWRTADGQFALRSQVWGRWDPDPDNRQYRCHNNGEILWASPDWLVTALSTLNRQLVFKVKLWKHKSSRDYTPTNEVKFVLVGLKANDGALRFWQAKKAFKQDN